MARIAECYLIRVVFVEKTCNRNRWHASWQDAVLKATAQRFEAAARNAIQSDGTAPERGGLDIEYQSASISLASKYTMLGGRSAAEIRSVIAPIAERLVDKFRLETWRQAARERQRRLDVPVA